VGRKKKKPVVKTLLLCLGGVIVLSVFIYYGIAHFSKQPFVTYPAFGIAIPQNYDIHGIDVSHYQEMINWNEVKDMEVNGIKVGFAFIKATEGVGRIDPNFRRNWLHCEKQKIARGAYHFFLPNRSGKLQAKNFVTAVQLKKGDLPPVLDVEKVWPDKVNMVNEILTWLKIVEQEYEVKPIIYTNVYFYNNYLKGYVDDYPFWIAHYLQPDKPRIEKDWSFWQHSEKGRVNGIVNLVDFNVFKGDSIAFRELLLK
jgi:lysozyme